MKNRNFFKFSLLCLIVLFTFPVLSQTLKFNQIKLIGSTAEIVPNGKAWKIESVLASNALIPAVGTSDNTYYTISKTIEINGSTIYINRASRYTENNSRYNSESTTGIPIGQVTELPFWIPEGVSLKTGTNAMFISVLEFEIVP